MADGHWAQNMWVSGDPFWDGIQLGETALPVLLVDLLARSHAISASELTRYWPMVRRAAGYIVRNGPSTQQDRWENERGYTPFTLATMIAALVVAADRASRPWRARPGGLPAGDRRRLECRNRELALRRRYRPGPKHRRRRLLRADHPPSLDEQSTPRIGHLILKAKATNKKGIPIDEVVSVDALALVRFGLRAPDDPRIVNTVKVIDALLKAETPRGAAWRRYNGDGYGEKADGSPFEPSTRGIGRAWPLLTGERAHYQLQSGRRDEALLLLNAMEAMAGLGGMIPEQVWDSADIPDRRLFAGRPTGSAMPLAWAHAEHLKLRRSLHDGRIFDQPPQTVRRYLERNSRSNLAIWRFDHQRQFISQGEVLRVEVLAPAVVRWSRDGWHTNREIKTRDSGLGIHLTDLETSDMNRGATINLTFYWPPAGRWEEKNFTVTVV